MDDVGEVVRRPIGHDLDGAQGDRRSRVGVLLCGVEHGPIVLPDLLLRVPGRP
jgi:hypothetical protein